MQNIEIIEKLNKTLEYLQVRKESLFEQIEQSQQRLEELAGDIGEQEAYLEIESKREKLESNIFNLYDTKEKYTKNKENLSNILEGKCAERDRLENMLEVLQKELEIVNENIVSNQIMVNYFTSERNESQEQIAPVDNSKLDITNRLQLCLGTLELDKERCALELRNLLSEIIEMQ